MLYEEMTARLKNVEVSIDEFEQLHRIYMILPFHKDVFCKMVDAIGVSDLVFGIPYFDELSKAFEDYSLKMRYQRSRDELYKLQERKRELEDFIERYETDNFK